MQNEGFCSAWARTSQLMSCCCERSGPLMPAVARKSDANIVPRSEASDNCAPTCCTHTRGVTASPPSAVSPNQGVGTRAVRLASQRACRGVEERGAAWWMGVKKACCRLAAGRSTESLRAFAQRSLRVGASRSGEVIRAVMSELLVEAAKPTPAQRK